MGRRAEGWKLHRDKSNANWTVMFTHEGRRHHRSTGFSTKTKAAKEAARIYAEVVNGANRKAARPLPKGQLADLLSEWLVEVSDIRSVQWHETLEIYARAHWLTRWKTMADLTSVNIQRYIGERLRAPGRGGKKVSPVTLAKELSGLRGFLKWSKRNGYLIDLPTWDAPEVVSDYESVHLTREQMEKVLAELPTRDQHPKRRPVRAYFTVMWATSLRKGTLSRIRWDDVDLKQGIITVRASQDKKRAARQVPLTKEAIAELKAISPGVGLVFGERDYRVSLRSAAIRAGIPEDVTQRLGNHAIRHSRLTELASNSRNIAAIQYMAGHKNLASTMRYVHGSLENARDLLDEVEVGQVGRRKRKKRSK